MAVEKFLATKPMLAVKVDDPTQLTYPLLASPKLDGIRCWTHPDNGTVARSLKPIPNDCIRAILLSVRNLCLDGELVVLDENGDIADYNTTQSEVMSRSGNPNFKFLVFDIFDWAHKPYEYRLTVLKKRLAVLERLQVQARDFIQLVPQVLIHNPSDLCKFEADMLAIGFEGSITRHLDGHYKSGRSTAKQEWLVKRKPFEDAEGEVIGFVERMHNTNEQTTNELGHQVRSHAQAGKVPAGDLGTLVLNTRQWGEVGIGSGFTAAQRETIWKHRDDYVGRIAKFKYQAFGTKDKPRIPVFIGWRNPIDL